MSNDYKYKGCSAFFLVSLSSLGRFLAFLSMNPTLDVSDMAHGSLLAVLRRRKEYQQSSCLALWQQVAMHRNIPANVDAIADQLVHLSQSSVRRKRFNESREQLAACLVNRTTQQWSVVLCSVHKRHCRKGSGNVGLIYL